MPPPAAACGSTAQAGHLTPSTLPTHCGQDWKDRAEASAVLAVIMVLLIGLPSWAPRFYARQRSLIVGGARLALWMQPWVVNPRGMQVGRCVIVRQNAWAAQLDADADADTDAGASAAAM